MKMGSIVKSGVAAMLTTFMLGAPMATLAARDAPEPTEEVMTMRLKGRVTFDTEGRVIGRALDTATTPAVAKLVEDAMSKWRFKPYMKNGIAVNATAPMQVTLAGRPLAGDKLDVRIERVLFTSDLTPTEAGESQLRSIRKPEFPRALSNSNVGGIVLVMLRFDDKGKVADAAISQSMLTNVRGDADTIAKARAMLEEVSLRSAKTVSVRLDKFDDKDDRVGTLPFNFVAPGQDNLGVWRVEQRGPRHVVPFAPAGTVVMGVSDVGSDSGFTGSSKPVFELIYGQGSST